MTLKSRLKQKNLLPSTVEKYKEILDGAGSRDLVEWIHEKVTTRTPLGTVLPLRAAVKHYLIGELGYAEDEVNELLPRARGLQAQPRPGLSADQLALYHAAVDQMDPGPCQTILSLLPQTGLRVGEIIALHVDDIRRAGADWALVFAGRGDKARVVPLTKAATKTLVSFLEEFPTTSHLFQGYGDTHISAHAVRKHTRRIANSGVGLEGLSPQLLRTTWTIMMLRRGRALHEVQNILGHENIATTQRYLHPDVMPE